MIGAVNHLYDVPTSLAEFKEDVVIGPEDNCADRSGFLNIFYGQNRNQVIKSGGIYKGHSNLTIVLLELEPKGIFPNDRTTVA